MMSFLEPAGHFGQEKIFSLECHFVLLIGYENNTSEIS